MPLATNHPRRFTPALCSSILELIRLGEAVHVVAKRHRTDHTQIARACARLGLDLEGAMKEGRLVTIRARLAAGGLKSQTRRSYLAEIAEAEAPQPVAPPTPKPPPRPAPSWACKAPRKRCPNTIGGAGEPYDMCNGCGTKERNRRLAERDAREAAAEVARLEALEAARPPVTLPLSASPTFTRRRWLVPDPNATPGAHRA